MTQDKSTSSNLPTPTMVERISGSVVTETALTLGAALAAAAVVGTTGALMVPILPVLAKYPAAERSKKRVEQALTEISADVERLSEELSKITDPNYRVLNEVILAVFQTTDEEKIKLLKTAVQNAVIGDALTVNESYALPRVLRDISPAEVRFIAQKFSYQRLQITEHGDHSDAEVFRTPPGSMDATLITGLSTLGLLEPGPTTYGGIGTMRFTTLAGKLLTLLT